jgi:hypothetical protein
MGRLRDVNIVAGTDITNAHHWSSKDAWITVTVVDCIREICNWVRAIETTARPAGENSPVLGIAFLIAILCVASFILGGLYYLFRDDHPSDEAKKRRKRLLVSNWK